MSAELTPQQLAFKLATRQAVKAAGGQDFVAREVGRTQSRISDYCSPEKPDFMPLDIVEQVEALGAGSPGHPHITRALDRAQGGALGGRAARHGDAGRDLGKWLAALASESSDVMGELAEADLASCCAGLSRNQRAELTRELDQLADVVARFRQALDGAGVAAKAAVRGGGRRRDTS